MTARLFLFAALILFFAVSAMAQTTNGLSDAEIQGRALADKILEQWPTGNFTNFGILQIRDGKGNRTNFPVSFQVFVSPTNWVGMYNSFKLPDTNRWDEDVEITHKAGLTNSYLHMASYGFLSIEVFKITENSSFANSDFRIADLGLEFFHWPPQKVLKKEIRRSCACTVLESTNPNPSTNSYSRVVSWVDSESLGIVEAYAYDMNGKKLKYFYPDEIKRVNGQWQVQTLVMENVQTGSKSRLKFNLKK